MRLFGALALTLLALIGLGVYVVWQAAVDELPAFLPTTNMTAADLERGRQLYRQIVPSGQATTPYRHIRLTERDLNLALNYALGMRQMGYGRIHLGAGQVWVDLALRLPPPLENRFFNFSLNLTQAGARLTLSGLWLGSWSVPNGLVRPMMSLALGLVPAQIRTTVDESILMVSPQEDQLWLSLNFDRAALDRAMEAARREIGQGRDDLIEAYRRAIARMAERRPKLDFAAVMRELFTLARDRSDDSDPVAENRALLIALAEASSGGRLGLPTTSAGARLDLRLAGREDYVQHFTLSAAMAVVAGEKLSDQVGLQKEIRDTFGGSGFSFSDLAADRAGSRFGAYATSSREAAKRVQALIAESRDTSVYLPRIDDLPEFLPGSVFIHRYGGVGGQGYTRLLDEIEARIAALPLYRPLY